ncbi:amidase signature enzyme [Xylariaceae sp. FL1019]|nr:amidase signature enzyme [Xylariaceae sp. FL1019]
MKVTLAGSLLPLLASTARAEVYLEALSTASSGAFSYSLGGNTYYTPSTIVSHFCYRAGAFGLHPFTVLNTNETTITSTVLTALAEQYESEDDVWNTAFLSGAVAIQGPQGAILDASVNDWIASYGAKYLLTSAALDITALESSVVTTVVRPSLNLRAGPYVLQTDSSGMTVRETYLVHRDNYEAFLFGVTPVFGSTAYEPVSLFIPRYQDDWVPVPSRLYSFDDARPLAGMRMAVKDIYDVEGVETGGGSRSYAEVYTAPNKTATALQKLLDLGAVVVGKSKTSQFAHGADPWEFVDIHYPFNPRGDGWLSAASSSSGPACAIAGYDWIDIALGSDTRGSVRKPASAVGSYGIRPTWKSLDLTGVIPLATEMDTLGFFARDPNLFYKVQRLWYEDSVVPVNKSFTSFPKKLLYPLDYFPVNNSAAQVLYDDFVSVLGDKFGMIKTPINVSDILRESPTPQISNFTAFQLNSNLLAEYWSWQHVGKPLAAAWLSMFPDRGFPLLDPNPRNAFERSFNRTEADYEAAVEIKNEFRDLFLEKVLRPDEETCSEGILMVDTGTGGRPSYREQTLNSLPGATSITVTVPNGGLANNYLASTAGCPEIGIPIGQVPYQSYASLQQEMVPVSVDLIAYPGCDNMLLELVKELADIDAIKTVKVGKTAF